MRYLLALLCLMMSTLSFALSLRADAPPRYVVQRGDTLWSISCRYLKSPWEWKQLLRANPGINNPDRLYPGDVLVLDYDADVPYIRVQPNGIVKLSPKMRITANDEVIPPIPLTDLKPFLDESLILDENILHLAPYVISFIGEHMLGGQGDEVYVQGLHPSPCIEPGTTIAYSIFRGGADYIDPLTKMLLGYKARLVGYGELIAGGEPATMVLTDINVGIKKGDAVLINNSPEFSLFFEPQTPVRKVSGFIIEMPDGMPTGNTQGAIGSVVVLNLGAKDGVSAGDVLGIYGKKRVVKDPRNHLHEILLPQERIGEVMIFRAFTKASYALVMRSTRAVYLLDSVKNP